MEASRGYERLPFGLLWAAAIPAAIVNPRSVRRFAEAMGIFEKTDRLDCGVIAWYAEVKRIQFSPPASATQRRLTALVLRLRQLTELRTAQTNQRRLVTEPEVQETFTTLLKTVAEQMRSLQEQITAFIDADPLWAALDRAFREIKGVAGRTVARLIADLPEIGTLPGKAVAKLNGVARPPAIAVTSKACDRSGVAAPAFAPFSTWWLRSFVATTRTSKVSVAAAPRQV